VNGFWLASYITLWVLVFLKSLLLLAVIKHVGNLRVWLQQAGAIHGIIHRQEGIALGESIPTIRDVLKTKVDPPVEIDIQNILRSKNAVHDKATLENLITTYWNNSTEKE
jgi:hypothetical protein